MAGADPRVALAWPRQAPFDEVWFLQLLLDDDHGLWVRYTLSHGVPNLAAVWAIASRRDRVHGGWAPCSLAQLRTDPHPFVHPHGTLGRTHATGQVDDLAWDLRWTGARRERPLIPAPLDRLGRTYESHLPEAAVSGQVVWGDRTWTLSEAPAILGHLHGRSSRLERWCWAHATGHAEDGTPWTFELLSAELGVAGLRLRPLTTWSLRWGERSVGPATPLHLAAGVVSQGEAHWQATLPGSLTVRLDWSPSATALVQYPSASGRPSWCRNSRFTELTVEGPHGRARSTRAAAEIGQTWRPPGRVLAGADASVRQ